MTLGSFHDDKGSLSHGKSKEPSQSQDSHVGLLALPPICKSCLLPGLSFPLCKMRELEKWSSKMVAHWNHQRLPNPQKNSCWYPSQDLMNQNLWGQSPKVVNGDQHPRYFWYTLTFENHQTKGFSLAPSTMIGPKTHSWLCYSSYSFPNPLSQHRKWYPDAQIKHWKCP